jgi:hypothetical protein
MKHVYPTNRKTLLLATVLIGLSTATLAQNPTTVMPADNCKVIENFNEDAGGFRSPSIYSGDDDVSFYYEAAAGLWSETNGLSNREASIISGVYANNLYGSITVGFKYAAPRNAEYRIRVINVNCNCSGGLDIIATTATGPVWTALPDTEGNLCVRLIDADIHQGQTLRFEISIRAKNPSTILFDDFSLGEEVEASPLPVTFTGIVARSENSVVNVQWDVADEIDVRGYEVERSTNGMKFETIGFVAAHGKPFYSFTDAQPAAGTVYYRVKNMDIDGQYKYSSIVKVTNKRASTLKLYPVPAKENVTLQHERIRANTTLTLTTIDGRVVKQIRPATDSYQTPVSLSGLQPGLYLLRLDNGQGETEAIKVVKQ